MPSVAVVGANGHTGRFVFEALKMSDVDPIAVTRSGEFIDRNGTRHPGRRLDVTSPSSLDEALEGAAAVINCAGPFFDTAEPIVHAALRQQIHYLDPSAEQHTTRRLFEIFDPAASAAEVVIAPAMAFYGALADLLATGLAAGETFIDAIDIAVGLDSWRPTRGTLETGRQNVYERVVIRDGRLVPAPSPPLTRDWRFAAPLGCLPVTSVSLSEMILIARHLPVIAATSFMNLKPLQDLAAAEGPPEPVGSHGRSGQAFVLEVQLSAAGKQRRTWATGTDIYAVSAEMIARAALELIAGRAPRSGVLAAGEIFDPHAFLGSLGPQLTVSW